MADQTRDQWIAILEAASSSPPSAMEDEWDWLMQELGLPYEHYEALLEAIKQGRWRQAKNPKAYVKTVAKREAIKMGLDDAPSNECVPASAFKGPDGSQIPYEQAIESLIYDSGTSDTMKSADGVWRRGGGRDDLDYGPYDEDGDRITSEEAFLIELPEELKIITEPSPEYKTMIDRFNGSNNEYHIHLTPLVQLNWQKWAALADFDEWECQVLSCRTSGKSRERALAEQLDEHSRKALQAAWKRFDRTGMVRLKQAIKKILQKMSRNRCFHTLVSKREFRSS
jgi:hypothetical protein